MGEHIHQKLEEEVHRKWPAKTLGWYRYWEYMRRLPAFVVFSPFVFLALVLLSFGCLVSLFLKFTFGLFGN